MIFGIQRLRLAREHKKQLSIDEISVIIPFRNESERLPEFLKCIHAQRYQPVQWIFVNDHSEDEWRSCFKGYESFPIRVLNLPEDQRGKKRAIRYGIDHATTDYVDKSGASYTKTFNGLVSSGTFVFTDSNGKSYTNTINMCGFISNSGQSDLYTNSAEYWVFGGNDIGQNETVSVSIKNVADNTKTASASSSTVGAYYLTLTTSAMTNLPTGDASAVTTRTKVTNTGNFTSAGGRFEASYLSAKNILYVY